ncbi:hypothetical protein GPECTOR_19g323 [Gonium pectorale]|uniref:Uncharacterized protein n=1 Tax=Gonium pectorale TaxID=33097 RepID=A0A150GJ88_GONPE|nr:hypothetical protein GPECTOR_19g323 [Gonium pectorale]|eukprot:KXZ49872.1 hypothetical protein GPECTOR_19g323 [Gonium pectorale]
MSHVSQRSVQQIEELIRLVRPEVVAVELCKERTSLLVEPEEAGRPPKIWHSRRVAIEGLPTDDPAWPSADELRGLLVCRPGRPVTQQDIEGDVCRLLQTGRAGSCGVGWGLFGSVRPGALNAGRDEAPEFLVRPPSESGEGEEGPSVSLVPPLGCIRFKVQPRSLPAVTSMSARIDSSLKGMNVSQAALDAICLKSMDDCKAGASGMVSLLRTRQRVQELAGQQVTVSFKGVDTGRVEMIVKAVKASDPAYLSGLESTAVNGEGFGIEPFRPQRGTFQVSKKMFIPTETLEAMRAERLGAAAAAAAAAAEAEGQAASASSSGVGIPQPRVRAPLRLWSEEEMKAAKQDEPPKRPVQDTLAGLMATTYARIQSKAGRTVGIEPGAAWRTAMEAATSVGSGALVLVDRPSNVTQHRMAAGLAADSGSRLAASAIIALGSLITTASTSLLPEQATGWALAAALAAAAAVAAPVVGPFLEVSRFADMSAEQIEDAVEVKEAIGSGDLSKPLKLFGEDALLDWPGAFPALIEERDAFMAKALAAVASGKPGVAPAYVRDDVDGTAVWRYAMPEGGPSRAAPSGVGDGEMGGLRGVRAVVGVVGSAHVRGMLRMWPAAVSDCSVDSLLQDVE